MIVAITASSPVISVALLEDGVVVGMLREHALRNASGVALRMLAQLRDVHRPTITGYAADTGPGSFIGARVGVTLAKTLAMVEAVPCFGTSAFDLIAPDRTVAIPNRKHEWLLRQPGAPPEKVTELPDDVVGYGDAFEDPVYPQADAFAFLFGRLRALRPEELMPTYFVDPSISQPKTPYREGTR